AEGLADLRDPESAPLFVSLLGRGSRSPLFEPAQRGLRALGPEAHDALLRTAALTTGAASRDSALLLGEDLVPEAVPVLIRLLDATPDDARVASELAILTAVDFRGREDP